MPKNSSLSFALDDVELGTGLGKSKKEAEQEAARHAIQELKSRQAEGEN